MLLSKDQQTSPSRSDHGQWGGTSLCFQFFHNKVEVKTIVCDG